MREGLIKMQWKGARAIDRARVVEQSDTNRRIGGGAWGVNLIGGKAGLLSLNR